MIFKNQSIVITGGASGIGLEVVKKVLSNNGTAVIIDRSKDATNNIKLDESLKIHTYNVDVTDDNQLKEVLENLKNKVPHITGLVCSAGKAPVPKRIEDTDLKDWNEIIKSHLTGTFVSCKIFGSHMAKNNFGSIVNISSVVGYNSGPVLAYGAAKAGIINLTSALSTQWAKNRVRVNAVAPGWTDTPLLRPKERNSQRDLTPILNAVPQKRLMEASEIADVISFLLSKSSSSITGTTIKCDGGTLAGAGWLPYGGFPSDQNNNLYKLED